MMQELDTTTARLTNSQVLPFASTEPYMRGAKST